MYGRALYKCETSERQLNLFQNVFFFMFYMQVPIKLTSVCYTDFFPQWATSLPLSSLPLSSPPLSSLPLSSPPHCRLPQRPVTAQLLSEMAKRVSSPWTIRTCLRRDGWAMTHTTNTLRTTPQDGIIRHLTFHSPPHPSLTPQLPSNQR